MVVEIQPLHGIEVGDRKQTTDMTGLFVAVGEARDHEACVRVMESEAMGAKIGAIQGQPPAGGCMRLAPEMMDDRFFIKTKVEEGSPIAEQLSRVPHQARATFTKWLPAGIIEGHTMASIGHNGVIAQSSLNALVAKVEQLAVIDRQQHPVMQNLGIVLGNERIHSLEFVKCVIGDEIETILFAEGLMSQRDWHLRMHITKPGFPESSGHVILIHLLITKATESILRVVSASHHDFVTIIKLGFGKVANLNGAVDRHRVDSKK